MDVLVTGGADVYYCPISVRIFTVTPFKDVMHLCPSILATEITLHSSHGFLYSSPISLHSEITPSISVANSDCVRSFDPFITI